ncbi:MAG: GDSL-type esterase/lipase family protein [Ilumatobacteraceae bacterium]|nr:GDSL-type esterase/lipase family protein [Ilumatobacteraceae bacterium]
MPPISRCLLALGAVVALAACAPTAESSTITVDLRYPGGQAPDDERDPGVASSVSSVAMVGDSITFMSADPLRSAFEELGLDVLAIDAQVGRRLTSGTRELYPGADVVRVMAATDRPDLWVVALGTNDIAKYDAEGYEDEIEALLDEVPDDAPLVWVDTWHRDELDSTVEYNTVLRDVLDDRDDTVVVDWFAHGDDPGVITGDGVHPTPMGTERFALVVAGGVDRLLATL